MKTLSLFAFLPFLVIPAILISCVLIRQAHADRFRIVDREGETRELVGRLHGSGQGAIAIERQDGAMEILSQGAILERDNSVDWAPFTADEMVSQLSERFTPELFRGYVDDNFVIGLVLMAPIERRAEGPAVGFMRNAARFMNNVQTVFENFARDLRLDLRDPEVPLVLLIFEADDDFNKYASSVTKGQGLSVSRISGFYDGVSNFLSIRMSECATFEVPLHEAIHQQVYNRGVLKRLAPIPSWFNEGIATGFEANEDRIRNGPTKVHTRFVKQVGDVEQVDWADLISEDLAFQGDVMAGDAYCLAWCLHWLLVTEYPQEYAEYVKLLSQKQPLSKEPAEVRTEEFRQHFGNDIQLLKTKFNYAIRNAMRRQRLKPDTTNKPGYFFTQRALADLELTAISRSDRGGLLELEGRLRNINPLRNLTYSVSVVTDGGMYAQWILPNIRSKSVVPLQKKYATEVLPGRAAQISGSFRVYVRSILPDSPEAQRWQRGQLPDPIQG